MVNATRFVLLIAVLTAGCSGLSEPLSIADAEAVGFEKDSQKIYQMVGAVDGWSGTWAGERVELYQFKDAASVNREVFQASTQDGNISGWVELCSTRNLLMLSKGEAACPELESLDV
jgi:hypothetical protein